MKPGWSGDPRAYRVDPAWVWSEENHELTLVASLRVTLEHPVEGVVDQRCRAWLSGLGGGADEYWQGGAAVRIVERSAHGLVLVLSSGGLDVLESLDHSVQELFGAVVAPEQGMSVRWEELPLA
ncbi:MAG: hypothetical protein ACI379_05080 [Nocardioides sp.]|uniref:hypothetical protein n=1 Tax=Nocardioides sp. TaxID=35761 RepID=UPI003F0DEE4A